MPSHPETCTCATCGAKTALLDFGFQAPDCVWAQPVNERSRRNNVDFAELSERRFVRGLLPVRLEDGEEFRYGIWLEVEEPIFDEVMSSWDDSERYPKLRFVATIANAVPPWGAKALGVEVDVGVRDQRSRPFVIGTRSPWLQSVLEHGWTMADYEAAVASFRR